MTSQATPDDTTLGVINDNPFTVDIRLAAFIGTSVTNFVSFNMRVCGDETLTATASPLKIVVGEAIATFETLDEV